MGPEEAIIRSGYCGLKAATGVGIVVIPVIHRWEKIDLSVKRIELHRKGEQGLLLAIWPPGYGKTTLMEYIANRIELIMKINGPAIGHQVTSTIRGEVIGGQNVKMQGVSADDPIGRVIVQMGGFNDGLYAIGRSLGEGVGFNSLGCWLDTSRHRGRTVRLHWSCLPLPMAYRWQVAPPRPGE